MSETKPTTDVIAFPSDDARDLLTPILREGAQKMLATAIELEAHAWLEERASLRDENGRRLVVRNGHQPTRSIQTGIGDMGLVRPRIHDRRTGDEHEVFHS
ncbi:MAG: IS256 family transposase, partial [Planctomycetes bacterium]|nr:IS256 family transposase [Planctomycetota bacterium]